MGEDGKDWPGIVGCKGCIQLQRDLVVARDAFLASREENDKKDAEIAKRDGRIKDLEDKMAQFKEDTVLWWDKTINDYNRLGWTVDINTINKFGQWVNNSPEAPADKKGA